MKTFCILFAAFVFSSSFAKPSPKETLAALKKSRQVWKEWREKFHNSYVWHERSESVFGGFGVTAVFVKDGKFVKSVSCSYSDNDERPPSRGVRTKSVPPDTMEEIYDYCEKTIVPAMSDKEHYADVTFAKNGLVKACNMVDVGCQDDCGQGPRVSSIDPLPEVMDEECVHRTPIYFPKGGTKLPESAFADLTKLAKIIRQSGLHIQLEGHADLHGSVETNLRIGDERAKAVREFLLKNGVNENAITTISFGKERPAFEGKAEEIQAKNRRVTMVVLENELL